MTRVFSDLRRFAFFLLTKIHSLAARADKGKLKKARSFMTFSWFNFQHSSSHGFLVHEKTAPGFLKVTN